MKNILKGIQETFNNVYIKALYLTILFVLVTTCLFILICNYPIFIIIFSLIIFTIVIYTLILDYLERG